MDTDKRLLDRSSLYLADDAGARRATSAAMLLMWLFLCCGSTILVSFVDFCCFSGDFWCFS